MLKLSFFKNYDRFSVFQAQNYRTIIVLSYIWQYCSSTCISLPNNATGPDELPAALLRKLAPALGPTIAQFFNESLL